ncbi:uncharacterized protein TRAVEDRAFT_68214 [Trametes versicolor FP-101664 SS1]|uniref:uncharacterized protein n=1 Tax=Trametes versicolor (strain FP-101664) TaxID=717944 RepID=UPI0004622396|nr:uncharacterized protein TRAVEDRAFT_68214 [Trametes versicolor FP-101664 SS1]EIW64399.1 hypothetical protein TRAVEDRAFT_68214 [Trametes versicolor FP-101664 SS1]
MPKSTKKKKDKAADFSKAKLKLGKGKQEANNVIDTSFKARSIALPTQSIATDRDTDAPTTRRRLTFDSLVVHLKHYNSNTRKDALLGLRELLEAHPELINVHLTALVNSCIRLISDEDASVRKTLLAFFTWLFRHVPRDDITPHSPVLLLFTTSAQTHIFPEIRIDAVRFLDIFLEYIPEVVTEGWTQQGGTSHGRRALEGYLGILNAGTTFGEGGDSGPARATSTASVVLSPASKLVVLKSLATFLVYAVTTASGPRDISNESSSGNLTTPTWYFSSSFASTSAFVAFDALLRPTNGPNMSHDSQPPSTRSWVPEASGENEDFVGDFDLAATSSASWAVQELNDIDVAVAALAENKQGSSGLDLQVASAAHVARTLHSTLVSTFLDFAPSVFSPSSTPPETDLQMVLVVCRICRSLYGRVLQNTSESGYSHEKAETDLQTMLSYLSPYFPFTVSSSSTAKRDIKIEQAFQDLNLIFCELSSFLVLALQGNNKRAPTTRVSRASLRGARSAIAASSASAVGARQIERVSKYIVQLLHGEAPSSSAQSSIPRPIVAQAYVSLLPTIWSLINNATLELASASATLFSAVVEHATRASSASATKRHTVDFIGRLVLLDREPEYVGAFKCGRSQEQDAQLEEWILQLPKTLWELGGNHPTTTETIVRLLLRLLQRRSGLFHAGTYTALRSRLVPYFAISHPARGKLRGPYAKLPADSPLRHLVLDLVATIIGQSPRKTDSGDDDLISAVDEATRETEDAAYFAGIKTSLCRD